MSRRQGSEQSHGPSRAGPFAHGSLLLPYIYEGIAQAGVFEGGRWDRIRRYLV